MCPRVRRRQREGATANLSRVLKNTYRDQVDVSGHADTKGANGCPPYGVYGCAHATEAP